MTTGSDARRRRALLPIGFLSEIQASTNSTSPLARTRPETTSPQRVGLPCGWAIFSTMPEMLPTLKKSAQSATGSFDIFSPALPHLKDNNSYYPSGKAKQNIFSHVLLRCNVNYWHAIRQKTQYMLDYSNTEAEINTTGCKFT